MCSLVYFPLRKSTGSGETTRGGGCSFGATCFLFTEGEIFWCVLQEGGSLSEAPSLWSCLMIVNILQNSFQGAWKRLLVSESSKTSLFCTLSLWMSWVSLNVPRMENSWTASSVQTGFLLSGVPKESWWWREGVVWGVWWGRGRVTQDMFPKNSLNSVALLTPKI